MLVVLLVLISIVGFAFGSFYGDGSSQIQIKVALNNQETALLVPAKDSSCEMMGIDDEPIWRNCIAAGTSCGALNKRH